MDRTIDELVPDISVLSPELQFLVRYARAMDAAFRIPIVNVRFGADALVGLVPLAGDVMGGGLSLFVLVTALTHGVPARIILRMVLRIVIDVGLGAIPGVGNIFDVFYRDKIANVKMLLEHRTR